MAKEILGFGIVGCGLVSQFHGRAISATPGAVLVSAVDMNQERLGRFCSEFSCEAASSFDNMLSDPRIDVVNILTPNAYHALFALPALQSGKHVIVERPPEMTLEKTDAMIAAAHENGVMLQVSLQLRFRKAVEAIRKAIDEGRFGRLLSGDAYLKWFHATDYYFRDEWRSKRDEGAGVTIQHAFHYIDLLHYLMGPVKTVRARMRNLAHPELELEDTLQACWEYGCGACGTLQASTALWPGTDVRLEINGENGTAVMQGERITVWQFRDERPEDEAIRRIGCEPVIGAANGASGNSYLEHQYMTQNLVRAIKYGEPLRSPCESARKSLEIALAMYRSADGGSREIPLPLN